MKKYILILLLFVVIVSSSSVFAEDCNSTILNNDYNDESDYSIIDCSDANSIDYSNSAIDVSKITPTFNLTYGNILVFPNNATGTVQVCLSDDPQVFNMSNLQSINLVDGKAVIKVEKSGFYWILVKYSGNEIYNSIDEKLGSNLIANVYIIDVNPVVMYYQDGSFLNISLTKDGFAIVDKTIKLVINEKTYYVVTDSYGMAQFNEILFPEGYYPVIISYGDTTVNTSITIKSTIIASNLVKYYRNNTQFKVKLLSKTGSILPDSRISFNINGISYFRTTNSDGDAIFNINLKPGNYILTVNTSNGEVKSFNVLVLSKIKSNNLTKYFKNSSQFIFKVLDDNGNVAANKMVSLNINGVIYNRISDADGMVKLNINLRPGNYIITIKYGSLAQSNIIEVLSTIKSKNIVMSDNNRVPFVVTILDEQGNPLKESSLKFNVNGVIYNRISDANGMAKLNINLRSGNYIITTMFNGLSLSNTIIINKS